MVWHRLILLISVVLLLSPRSLRAEPMREFVMSATYGVLAGTLVGAASLAFTEHPGDNLNRVARGASLGLYAGILLGVYIVYLVPSEDEQALESTTSPEARILKERSSLLTRVHLTPILDINKSKFTGAVLSADVLRF